MESRNILFGSLLAISLTTIGHISNCLFDARNPEQYLTRLIEKNSYTKEVCFELASKLDDEETRLNLSETCNSSLADYFSINNCNDFLTEYNRLNSTYIDQTICSYK